MKKPIYVLASCICLSMASCSNTGKQTQESNDSTIVQADTALIIDKGREKETDTADVTFFKKAAIGGMTEVEAASRMLVVSKDSAVTSFAKMMVADHTKANLELKTLAATKGIHLPEVLPASQTELVKKLENYKDDGRNEYYAQMMIEDHKRTIDLFNLASNSKDAAIAAFAKSTLPTLTHHYKMAVDMEDKVSKPIKAQGDDPLKMSDKKQMIH